jgi:hypothetical protein
MAPAPLRDGLLRALLRHFESGQGIALVAATNACCPAAIEHGPTACTCWEPVHDLPQAEPSELALRELDRGVPPPARRRMCDDCAYRPESPERAGDPDYAGDPAELERLAREDRFWCHTGMRKITAWRHPSGITLPAAGDGDYRPPVVGGIPFKADGSIGEQCAGWDARRRALAAADQRVPASASPSGSSDEGRRPC